MSKATSKMNKKELIEKIKELEQEKHEDKERFIGAGQIIKKLQEENDKKSKTLQQSGHTDFINTEKIKELEQDKEKAEHKAKEYATFIIALDLYDEFTDMRNEYKNAGICRIDLFNVIVKIGKLYKCEEEKCEKD